MRKFWQFLHDGMIVRRIILGWALWMSTWISIEMVTYAQAGHAVDVGLAAVIGAVLTPVLGLTGFIIKFYAQHPYGDKLQNEEDLGE